MVLNWVHKVDSCVLMGLDLMLEWFLDCVEHQLEFIKLNGQAEWGTGSYNQIFVCNRVLDFISIDELINVSNQLVTLVSILGTNQDFTTEIND